MALIPSNKTFLQKTIQLAPYLTPDEVLLMATKAGEGRNGERDELLIVTLFQTGLRVSEAISITPRSIGQFEGHTVLNIVGKGRKLRKTYCPEELAHRIKSFAYSKNLGIDDSIFNINRKRAWQIIKEAGKRAGLQKEVWPHLLRHSNAIESLRQTGNPKALQHHLGHSSTLMTMRYLSTLTVKDSLRIQSKIKF